LGLSTCRRLVEQMHGSLAFTTELGKGRPSTNPSGRTTPQARPRCGRPWSSGWRRSPTHVWPT
jgi:hypothetical protein